MLYGELRIHGASGLTPLPMSASDRAWWVQRFLSAALMDVTDRSCVLQSLERTSVLSGSEDEAFSFELRRSLSSSLLRAR